MCLEGGCATDEGGNIELLSGAATGTSSKTADIEIASSNTADSGDSGQVTIVTGNATTGNSGDVLLTTGSFQRIDLSILKYAEFLSRRHRNTRQSGNSLHEARHFGVGGRC